VRLHALARVTTVATLALAVTLVHPAGAAFAAYGDPLTSISTGPAGLVWHATPSAAIANLDAALPNVGVADVVGSANHPMPGCSAAETATLPIAPAATSKLCWDDGDAGATEWNPQGITTSGDADDDGSWGESQVVLSGWQYTVNDARHNDARVAFIDYHDPAAAAYRWVYLVAPNAAGTDFSAAKAHQGGMIWYGDKLMVTAVGNTGVAIRVFSMSHILQVDDGAAAIGRTSKGWAAYGYQYVMPQIGYYSYSAGTCSMATNTGTPCFSSISLDRSTSPDSMVAAEYFADGQGSRLFRYPFAADYLPAPTASRAYASGVANAQGVLSYNGRWYVTHSSATYNGQLWGLAPGVAGVSKSCTNPGTSPSMCWALHPEGLTYWLRTGLVWSQTEAPNQRTLFTVPLTSLP
jgi:hypothetical protein